MYIYIYIYIYNNVYSFYLNKIQPITRLYCFEWFCDKTYGIWEIIKEITSKLVITDYETGWKVTLFWW